MDTKKKRLWIRISEAEAKTFKAKSSGYDSVSAMVRAAVSQLDDRSLSDRMRQLDELTAWYKSFDNRLSWAGSNINQLAKRANEAHAAGIIPAVFFSEMLMPELIKMAKEVSELKAVLMDITKTAMDSRR